MKKLNEQIVEYVKELYQKGNSTNDIVKIAYDDYKINVSSSTIQKWLKINGALMRNKKEAIRLSKRKHLPINEIVQLYTKNRVSLTKLSKMYKSHKTTLHKILAENNVRIRTSEEVIMSNRKFERHSFGNNDNEKAYLIGFTEGDITAFRKSKYTIGLRTHSTHKSFAELVKNCFCACGNVKVGPAKNKTFGGYMWRITVYLDNSFDFLLPAERKELIREILSTDKSGVFMHFLAGLIDSDGSLIVRKVYDNFQFLIRIFGEDTELIKGVENRLKSLGFKPHLDLSFKKGHIRKYGNTALRYNHDYFTLELSNKKDVTKLLENLPIRHSEKTPKKDLIIQITTSKLNGWDDIKSGLDTLKENNEENVRTGLLEAEEMFTRLHPKTDNRKP